MAKDEAPEWASRPGEVALSVARAQGPEGSGLVVLQVGSGMMTTGAMMRPAMARWLADRLNEIAGLAESKLVLPTDGQLRQVNGQGQV